MAAHTRFVHILFDLDNTLYSCRTGLEAAVAQRVREYTAAYLGVSVEEAAAERRKCVDRYGTTLEWLMDEKGLAGSAAIDDYYRKVHPEDEADTLEKDPALRAFLQSLPCPCSVLTNANREHADRILRKLGVEDLFAEIFDMRRNGYRGKPRRDVFVSVLDAIGAAPEEVLFVDDVPAYLTGFLELGGRGILLDEMDAHSGYAGERIRNLKEIRALL
jgi:putative hydrolase of the HAD superfamily